MDNIYKKVKDALNEVAHFDEKEFRRRYADVERHKGKYLTTTGDHKGEGGAGYVTGYDPNKQDHVILSVHQGGGVRSKNDDTYKDISVHKDHLREPKMSDYYKEDIDQIDEISDELKDRYKTAAKFNKIVNLGTLEFDTEKQKEGKDSPEMQKFRQAEIDRSKNAIRKREAGEKLAKEEVELDESRGSDYALYHKSYTDAINHALGHHGKSGLTVSDDDRFHHVGVMSKKPSEGNTTSVNLPATHATTGKKHTIHIQVYNKGGSHPYELNTYSSGVGRHNQNEEVDLDEAKKLKTTTFEGKGKSATVHPSNSDWLPHHVEYSDGRKITLHGDIEAAKDAAQKFVGEEDEGWYTHAQMYGSKKSEKHPEGISAAEWKSGVRWDHRNNKRINVKEEVELDESVKRYGTAIFKGQYGDEEGHIYKTKSKTQGYNPDRVAFDVPGHRPLVAKSFQHAKDRMEKHPNFVKWKDFSLDHPSLGEEVELEEKHLTPAEKSKREEIAKAMAKENPNMPMGKKMAIATSTAKKVAEDKDHEYGYEGDMAISQLKQIQHHLGELMSVLKPDTDLPEWVQSKITLATDYIQTASDYVLSQMSEEIHEAKDKIKIELSPENAKKITHTVTDHKGRPLDKDGRLVKESIQPFHRKSQSVRGTMNTFGYVDSMGEEHITEQFMGELSSTKVRQHLAKIGK